MLTLPSSVSAALQIMLEQIIFQNHARHTVIIATLPLLMNFILTEQLQLRIRIEKSNS
jgi:hypothetical protein